MGKISIQEHTITGPDSTGAARVDPNMAGLPARAAAEAGAALAGLGEKTFAISNAYEAKKREARDAIEAANLEAQAYKDESDFVEGLRKRDDYGNYEEEYNKWAESRMETYRGKVTDPDKWALMQAKLAKRNVETSIAVRKLRDQKEQAKNLSDFLDPGGTLETYTNLYVQTGDTQYIEELSGHVDNLVRSMAFTGQQGAHAKMLAARGGDLTRAKRMIEGNPDAWYAITERAKAFPYLSADDFVDLDKEAAQSKKVSDNVKALELGVTKGTEIYKLNPSGDLAGMFDAIAKSDLTPKAKELAETRIKELRSIDLADKEARAKTAAAKVNEVLANMALERGNGINKVTDLTGAQWKELIRDNPEYAAKLQDSMRKDADYLLREKRRDEREAAADARAARAERRAEQVENEASIMSLPAEEFFSRDLREDLATSKISPMGYRRLLAAQKEVSPEKREGERAVLAKFLQDQKDGLFGSGPEGNAEYIAQKEAFMKWSRDPANKTKDPSEYYQKLTEPYKQGLIGEFLDSLWPDKVDMKARRLELGKGLTAKKPAPVPIDKWVEDAKKSPQNKGKTDAQLREYYNNKYQGGR